jgi:hypothetical protein
MRRTSLVIAIAALGASIAFLACSGGVSPEQQQASAKPTTKDPNTWPADDRSMCDWKNKPELEVSETAGPGALKPNVRRVYKTFGEGETRHKTLVCREADTNLDGIKDIVRTFNAKGEAVHEEADANYDGKIDTWISFVNGRMSEEDLDTNGDGRIDVWKYYLDGVLSRVKRDTNFDGKPDVWEIYNKGHLERMGVDTQHTGHVDRWDRDSEVQRRAEEEDIKAREKMQQAQAAAAGDAGAPSAGDAGASAGDAGSKPKPKRK